MIPKIIHYCWFGPKPLSILEEKCLASWKQWCPDFEFKLWNESNFPVEFSLFTQEAYRLGYYAFVSDVARIWVLYHHGGIYLDTDMLLLGSLEDMLSHDFFIGEHLPGEVGVGILGSRPSHPLLGRALDFYFNLTFDPKGMILIPNVFDKLLKESNSEELIIYPTEYFYPLPFSSRGLDFKPFLKKQTLAVHLWNHSWKDEFGLLKDFQFFNSIRLVFRNWFRYPDTYRSVSYLRLYFLAFSKYTKRYLHQLIYSL